MKSDNIKSEVYICPYCLARIGAESRCMGLAHHKFDKNEWSNFSLAYSPLGLLPPKNGNHQYSVILPGQDRLYDKTSDNIIVRGLPFFIESQDVIKIGSSDNSDILISGAIAKHAAIFFNLFTNKRWIYDYGSPSGTFVNDEAVHIKELHNNDIITIADIKIKYLDDTLCLCDYESRGINLLVKNLNACKNDGSSLLGNISFQAREGEFIGILGPSGCGKSSLIQRVVGLADFEEGGQILFNGKSLKDDDTIRESISYLPQNVDDTLHCELTVSEEISFYEKILLADKGIDYIDDLGLGAKRMERVAKLSGGEKRRLAIALAMLADPAILVLDEPTAGLDPAASSVVMEMLKRLSGRGKTILCATHILDKIDLFSEVLVLAPGGYVRYFGEPGKVCEESGVENWQELYEKLAEDSRGDIYYNTYIEDLSPLPLPEPKARASFCQSIAGYFERLFVTLKTKPLYWILNYLLNPAVIALLLLIACKHLFKSNLGLQTVYFCSVIASFWLGLSGSVRSLVAERIPRRCMERLAGIGIWRYLLSHIGYSLFLAVVQNFVFTGLVFLFRPREETIDALFSDNAFFVFYLILTGVGIIGALAGLAISAFSKNEIKALLIMPLAAILALFFSKPVLQSNSGNSPLKVVKHIEKAMPTYYPQSLMKDVMNYYKETPNPKNNEDNKMGYFGLLLGYGIILILLIYYFQDRNESAWDGR